MPADLLHLLFSARSRVVTGAMAKAANWTFKASQAGMVVVLAVVHNPDEELHLVTGYQSPWTMAWIVTISNYEVRKSN